MEELLIKCIEMVNPCQLIILGSIIGILHSKTSKEMRSIREELHSIDKRLYGVEVILHNQDSCVLRQDKTMKKAE